MSNTRRIRWSESEVTAADAIDVFEHALTGIEADAAFRTVTGHMVRRLVTRGAGPGLVADLIRHQHALGTAYWADIARTLLADTMG
jgi:hypothetical protein